VIEDTRFSPKAHRKFRHHRRDEKRRKSSKGKKGGNNIPNIYNPPILSEEAKPIDYKM